MPLAEDELVSAQKQVGVCQRCRIGSEERRKRWQAVGVCERKREHEAKKHPLNQTEIAVIERDLATIERQKCNETQEKQQFSVLIVQICILKQVHSAQKTCNL